MFITKLELGPLSVTSLINILVNVGVLRKNVIFLLVSSYELSGHICNQRPSITVYLYYYFVDVFLFIKIEFCVDLKSKLKYFSNLIVRIVDI